MEKQEIKCPTCSKEFDNSVHTPCIIPSCGHSLCSDCINKSLSQLQESDSKFICPIDK